MTADLPPALSAHDSYGPGAAAPHPDAPALAAVAIEVAEAAAQQVRRRRAEVFGIGGGPADAATAVQSKSTPTDPVTVVDTECEAAIRAHLARLRPDDTVLGEELGGSDAVPDGAVQWVVDPIDGTVNFMYGVPAYAVSLAAQIGGRTVAGVVVDVAGRETFTAIAGAGATVTGRDGHRRPLGASAQVDPALALVATGFAYRTERRVRQGALIAELLPQVRDIRRVGAAALDLCMVAAGRVDAHFEHGLSPWDWAAGALIAAEAGAQVWAPGTDSGSDAGAVTVAVAPGLAAPLIALLDRVGALEPIPVR